MRKFGSWLKSQFAKLLAVPLYFRALAKEWMSILFGETLVGVAFLIWWALANPSNPKLIAVFVAAMFVAGFYAWHAAHLRLQPKFKIEELRTNFMASHPRGGPATYFTFFVENASEGSTINDIKVKLVETDPPIPNLNFTASLFLQHDNYPEPRKDCFNLNPSEKQGIDLVSAVDKDNYFEVRHIIPGVNRNAVCGVYRFKVVVTARDTLPIVRWFRIEKQLGSAIKCDMEPFVKGING